MVSNAQSVFSAVKEHAWTRRVVLPIGAWTAGLGELEELVYELEGVGADYVAIPLPWSARSLAEPLLRLSDRVFVGISIPSPEPSLAPAALEVLTQVFNSLGPLGLTRLAFGLGGLVETPYFPATHSTREGISLSVLYAADLDEAAKEGGLGRVEERMVSIVTRAAEFGRSVSSDANVRFLGIDPSLSPWMEESVARLVETLTGEEFGGPGTYWAVWWLNSRLSSLGSRTPTIGFSEVMLPVAEDDRLKELASRARLRLRELVGLSTVCVAGVDMVVLPLSEPARLARIMSDIFAAAMSKGRPMGVRLILAEARPGDWVDIDKFGSVPVLSP